MFEKRKAYTHQPEDLKRDIKAFFDTYKIAQHQAKELLFQIADVKQISKECLSANKTLPTSKLILENDQPHSLIFHKKFLDDLSSLLRVYVLSALQMYGELDEIQLIKIHINSGKVTLLGYEGFDGTPLPELKERVKIKMAEQDVDFFDYIREDKRPVLLDKIEYIDESFEDYKKQTAFNKRLDRELSKIKPNLYNITRFQMDSLLLPKLKIRGYKVCCV
jgi:DNA phosphorothioation-associated putative methyltransferase